MLLRDYYNGKILKLQSEISQLERRIEVLEQISVDQSVIENINERIDNLIIRMSLKNEEGFAIKNFIRAIKKIFRGMLKDTKVKFSQIEEYLANEVQYRKYIDLMAQEIKQMVERAQIILQPYYEKCF